MENALYYGDNLDILRRYIKDETVDLVYLDPPFKSNQNYNVLFKEQNGAKAASQIRAFEDTWTWDQEDEAVFADIVTKGGSVADCLQAFRTFLGPCDMLAYLVMMAPRLMELRRVMKPTASIYLHCDPAASHYLKMLLDAIFGPQNFLNEIIWRRTGSHNSSRRFGPIHDILFFYARSDEYFFRVNYRPYMKGHVDGYFKQKDKNGLYWTNALTGAGTRKGESGKPWRNYDPTSVGRHWAIPGKIANELGLDEGLSTQKKLDFLDKAGFIDHPACDSKAMPTYRQHLDDSPGQPFQDIWAYQPHTQRVLYATDECIDEDVRWLVAQGDPERLGYPTQKPSGLLERIIKSSCPDDGVVLDPFCGCGTTIAAAQKLGRPWIGIDITHLAITLMKNRLADTFGNQVAFKVIGEPVSIPDAAALAASDQYQFQYWALGLVGARPEEQKKGADKGIDGKIPFQGDELGKFEEVLISVKAGHLQAVYVRDLRGVIDREKAAIGVLISMEEPTKPMLVEAATAGFFESKTWGKKYPKLQLLTIKELLAGKKVDMPPIRQVGQTFKKAEKFTRDDAVQLEIKEPKMKPEPQPARRRGRPRKDRSKQIQK